MARISQVSIDDSDPLMSELGPVLAEFNTVVERYCDDVRSPPYWFNERASVSLLAAAAWRLGWVGVEEFSTRKVLALRDDPEQGIHRHGRCDLFLRSPRGTSFAIEAKQVVANQQDLDARTRDALRRARDDARQLFSTEASCRLAVAFVVPILRATDEGEHSEDLDEWQRSCVSVFNGPRRINHACIFPGVAGNFLGPRRRAFWPGVILVAQRIFRRASTVTSAAGDSSGQSLVAGAADD